MSPASTRVSAGGSIADAEGFDLRPDPLRARTAADFMAALRCYRAWAGDPSYRKMASRASYALAAEGLPRRRRRVRQIHCQIEASLHL